MVRADAEERQISVSVLGPPTERLGLAALACAELRRIHMDIDGLNPIEELEASVAPGEYVPVATLRADERARRESSIPTPMGSVPLNNKEELNRISTEAARDETRVKPKLFISYSSQDARQHDQLLIRLKKLRTDGLVDTWSDRCLDPGVSWDQKIKQELLEADVVLFLVSAAFEATDYIRDIEVAEACARADLGRCVIVPVILEKCDWENTSLAKYTALPSKAKPIRDVKPQRNAWHQVQQMLRPTLENLAKRLSGASRPGADISRY